MLEEGPKSLFRDFEPENLGAMGPFSSGQERLRKSRNPGVLEAYHNVDRDHEVNINMQISGHGGGGVLRLIREKLNLPKGVQIQIFINISANHFIHGGFIPRAQVCSP